MSKTFDFQEQYDIGKHGENEVYEILDSIGWKVEPVQDLFLQARGLDAFISKAGTSHSIEVKTDLRAIQTGNAFLELFITKSGIVTPGWVYKTCAQLVLYFVPGTGIFALDTLKLRERVGRTRDACTLRVVKNKDYTATGIIDPLAVLCRETMVWKHVW